jgi:hypothetical protein
MNWFGHGIGSFYIDFPFFQEGGFARRFDHAHNDLLELGYEFGVLALLPVVLWLFAVAHYSPISAVLAVFAVEGCFGFPLFLPVTGALGAISAGHLCGTWERVRSRQLAWQRGIRTGTRQFELRRREAPPSTSG